jgi:ribosomal protein S18 acetylase RimI-like enzyme
MRFELDETLIDNILFSMEDQDGVFFLDTQKCSIVSIDDENNTAPDTGRFISLPSWSSNDGFRLMEKFAGELKNPLVRQELTDALNKNKGVFRSFKNVLEQYPETEKIWFAFKEQKMKDVIVCWYNSLREEWGMLPLGAEPEDISSLVLEDFTIRTGTQADLENALSLHKSLSSGIYEKMNPFVFPADISLVAQSAPGDFAGFICAVKDASFLRICALEIKEEYRGMGLGKTLLSKFLEEAKKENLTVTFDLPEGADFFSRVLLMENFKPSIQRFILNL